MHCGLPLSWLTSSFLSSRWHGASDVGDKQWITQLRRGERFEITKVLGIPPYLVRVIDPTDGEQKVCLFVEVDGKAAVLLLREDVIGDLVHVLDHGRLPT